MKLLLCAFMLATSWALAANEITDRADVDKLIFALKDALGLITNRRIQDAKTIAGIFFLKFRHSPRRTRRSR